MKKSSLNSFKYIAGPLSVMFLFILHMNTNLIGSMKDFSSDLGNDLIGDLAIDLTGNDSTSGQQQQQQQQQEQPREKTYSILPSKVYSVIGLESSGTNFVTSLIRDALNQTEYREADFRYENAENEALDVQVQHFSLPQGSSCHEMDTEHTPILDLVLPSVCSKLKVSDTVRSVGSKAAVNTTQQPNEAECGQIAHDLWKLPPSENTITYPKRYLLDIVSHKEWYEKHGVEQYFIIVIRDKHISRKARSKSHCQNPKKLDMEEDIGTKIIIDAINKYILEDKTYNKIVTRDSFKFWRSNFSNGDHTNASTSTSKRRRLQSWSSSLSIDHTSNGILNKNNVVVVSYESLMLLQKTYVTMLFDVLGIKVPTDFEPKFKDGNEKYLENKS